jgi:hypothetical protein
MALQTFSVRRAQDPVLATAVHSEITPLNWHKFPPAGVTAAQVKPQWVRTNTWNGGVYGDDVVLAKSNVLVDEQGRGDYTPRNQDDRRIIHAAAGYLGATFAVDIARPRGAIDPSEPYPTAASPAEPAPTISSLAPNTAAAGTLGPLGVIVTGTNFTQWTKLIVGGAENLSARYVSPTKMTVTMTPATSVPGVITFIAWDHNVASAPVNFTYT